MEVEVTPVECHGAENRLLTLARVLQSIPLPETQQSNEKEQVKNDIHRTSTKETYESIEKSTPIKNLAQEEQENNGQSEDHAERVQVDFNFKVRQIDVLLEKSPTEWSDLREKFFSFTLGLMLAQVKVKRFDIEWNVSLKSLTTCHDEFIRETNESLCLFINEGNDSLINATGLLTSPSNPDFDSRRYRSIETQVSLKIGRCQLSLQLESLFSLVQFIHQFKEKSLHSDQKNSTSSSSSSSSKRATMEIDVTFQGMSLLIGNELRQMLLVQVDDIQLRLSRLQRSDALRLLLHRFDVLHSTSLSKMEYLITNQGSGETPLLLVDLLFVDLSHSRRQTPRDDQRSHVKVRCQKMQWILLYKYVDLLLNLLRLFQSNSNDGPIQQSPTDNSPSLLTSLQEKSLIVDIDLLVDLPAILLPVDSQSNDKLLLDLGQITNEQHRILLANVRVDRLDAQETCLVQCSPVDIVLADHLHSMTIQWEFVEVQLNPDDYAFLKRLASGNFRESVCPTMLPVNKDDEQSRPVTDAATTTGVPAKKATGQVPLHFQFELKRVTMSMSFDGGQRTTTTTNVSVFEMQQIQVSFDQKNVSECQGEMKIHSFSLKDLAEVPLSTHRVDEQHDDPIFLVQLQSEDNVRRGWHPSRLFSPASSCSFVILVHGYLTNLSLCLSSNLITSLRDLVNQKPQDNLVPLPSSDSSPCCRPSLIELSLPPPARFVGQSTGPSLPAKTVPLSSSRRRRRPSPGRTEMALDFHMKSSRILLRESDTSNGLAIEVSERVIGMAMRVILLHSSVLCRSELDGQGLGKERVQFRGRSHRVFVQR